MLKRIIYTQSAIPCYIRNRGLSGLLERMGSGKHCVIVFIVWAIAGAGFAQTDIRQLDARGMKCYRSSDYDSARYYFTRALDKHPSRSLVSTGDLYLHYANTLRMLEAYTQAFPKYVTAETIFRRNKDTNRLITCYTEFAEFHRSLGKRKDAAHYLNKAEQLIRTSSPDDRTHALFLNRKAAYASEYEHNHSKALKLSFQAVDLARSSGDQLLEASSYNQIGFDSDFQNDPSRSKTTYFHKALALYKAAGNQRYVADMYMNFSRHFLHVKQSDSAAFYAQAGYELCKARHFTHAHQLFCLLLYEVASGQSDEESELKYYIEYTELGAKTERSRWNKTLYELEKKYQVAVKEKELKNKQDELRLNRLQLQRNQSRLLLIVSTLVFSVLIAGILALFYFRQRKTSKQLTRLLSENQFLLEESNHRIKNNLQLVTSLLHRQLDASDGLNNLATVLEEIESISTLHKHIYLSENKKTVDLHNYLLDIRSNFTSFLHDRSVTTELDIVHTEVEINKAMYVGLLFTELLINSLKHAFATTMVPEISLKVTRASDRLQFIYRDNGSGLSDHTQPELVILLCKQLKAEYILDNRSGFYFQLTLNL